MHLDRIGQMRGCVRMFDWIAFAVDVFKFWRNALVEAFYKAWGFVGQTREGLMFAVLVVLVFFVYLFWHHGWKGIWSKFWEKALEAAVVALMAFAVVLLWKLFAEPWAQVSWATGQMELARNELRSSELRKSGDSATIVQQIQEIDALKQVKPHSVEPRQLTPAQQTLMRKLTLDYLNYSGPNPPNNDAIQQPVTVQWIRNDNVGQAFAWQLNGIFPKRWKGNLTDASKDFWKKSVGASAKGVQIISNSRTYQVLALEDLFAHIDIHAKVDVRVGNVQRINGIMVAIGAP